MKTPSKELFILIKSLSSAEKLHFKMFSRKHRESNYLKLFDAIDRQKVYNEVLLKQKLSKEPFIKNLKFVKSYLAESILSFLTNFHAGMDIEIELHKLVHRIKILINKGMQDMAAKLLLKANKLALDYECYEYLLMLNRLEVKIILLGKEVDVLDRYVLKQKEQDVYIMYVKNFTEYKKLYYQLVAITLRGATRKIKESTGRLNEISRHPLLSSPDMALSFSSLEQYFLIHFLLSFHSARWDDAAYKQQKKWVHFLEKDKQKLLQRADSYFVTLANFIIVQVHTGRTKETENSFKKALSYINTLPLAKKKDARIQSLFINVVNNYMSAQIDMHNYERAISTWEGIKNLKIDKGVNENITVFLNMFKAHFYLRHFHEALNYLNKIIHSRTKASENIQQYVRIFILLTHYELGNHELLPYLTRSVRRYLVKNTSITVCDKIILSYFERSLPKISSKQEERKTFSQFKQKLIESFKELTTLIPGDRFDFISWLESKIEGRSFAEVVRERAGAVNS